VNFKKKVLFYRDYREFRGGHLKVYDYFNHLAKSSRFAPEIFLTSQSLIANPWSSCTSIKSHYDPESADILFLAGLDWKALDPWPEIEERIPVVNLIQSTRHGEEGDERKNFLSRKALRICVSHQVKDVISVTGLCNGPLITIENGIDLDESDNAGSVADPGSVLILGIKQQHLASQLAQALSLTGLHARCINKPIERTVLLKLVSQSEIIVTLPNSKEGFYLPALEVMRLKRSLVCPDCIGNRSFCEHMVTCLMPEPTVEALLKAVNILLASRGLAESLKQTALNRVRSYTIQRERADFLDALHRLLQA
jgi:hypothetical protein